MKRIIFSAACISAFLFFASPALLAQDKQDKEKDKEKDKNKVSQYDEIIIRKKTDKDSKVTIEIKDGQVIVNGKPIDQYDDKDISVLRRRMPRMAIGVPSPFRAGSTWSYSGDNRLFYSTENSAFLGVTTEEEGGGAKITSVSEGSAAEKAGLKEGDIITKVDDNTIEDPQDLSKTIGKYKPEDKITVTYKRDGKENKVSATLGKSKSRSYSYTLPRGQMAPNMQVFPHIQGFDWDGDGLAPSITVSGRPRIGIRAQDTEDGKGAKVMEVMDGSVAEKAGLKEGDIITEFDGKAVNGADELANAARDAREKNAVTIKFSRDGKAQTAELKTPKRLKTANL